MLESSPSLLTEPLRRNVFDTNRGNTFTYPFPAPLSNQPPSGKSTGLEDAHSRLG